MNRLNEFQFLEDFVLNYEVLSPMSDTFGYARDEAEQLCQQAYERQMQGALAEAVQLYKRSIELYPTAEAHTFLGWAYHSQGRTDDAILECQKAIGIDQDFGNPYNDIGAYLIEQGKYDEAIIWLQRATEAKRYDAVFYAHYNLGRVWEKQGKWFDAFEAYSKALDHQPDYRLAKEAIGRLSSLMN